MLWKKKGQLWETNKTNYNMIMLPTPLLVEGNRLRIYCGLCDENNVGKIGYVDVNPLNPSEVLYYQNQGVLERGRKGCFDDNGVVPVSVVRVEQQIYLYYVGFQLGVNVPYYMFTGLAISDDGGYTFHRYSEAPVLDRYQDEVYARCGCYVLKDENKYKMWYIGSCKDGWTLNGESLKPWYTM